MSTLYVGLDENIFCAMIPLMSPEQCRAARAWLEWSQDELADKAQVSNSTVRDFEARRRVPIANNLTALRRALETAGIALIFGEKGEPTGIAGPPRHALLEKPPADGPRRRPGRRAAKAASPKRRSPG